MASVKRAASGKNGACFIVSFEAIKKRYGKQAKTLCEEIEKLGKCVDVPAGISPEDLRKRMWALPEQSLCLVGGIAIFPMFMRPNPTGPNEHGFVDGPDKDKEIPTDAPYGADPGDPDGDFCPAKAISRVPDGAPLDAASFLRTLLSQEQALTLPTRPGSFELASDDLEKPAVEVSRVLRKLGGSGHVLLSPSQVQITDDHLTTLISKAGRIHLLLHGSQDPVHWRSLFGRPAGKRPKYDIRALSAPLIELCDLRGAIIALNDCYGAMLDDGDGRTPARSAIDQISLAALAQGAKCVFGATRSNWVDTTGDKTVGPALTAHLWTRLGEGLPAAEALRRAKRDLHDDKVKNPVDNAVAYAKKTLLQSHCFGHPLARLPSNPKR